MKCRTVTTPAQRRAAIVYGADMALHDLRALALGFPIVVATLTPDTAEACPGGYYDPCSEFDFWADLTPKNAAKIPADGVLVLQGAHQGGDDADWLTKIELTVTKDGQPVAGALAATSQHGVLIWRPDAPWSPGATYQLTGALMNPDIEDYCGPATIPLAADLVIDSEVGATIGAVQFTGTVTSTVVPQVTLETLACCPGATPSEGYGGCGGTYVNWDDTQCAPMAAYGSFSVEIVGEPAATGPVADEILYTLLVDGMEYARDRVPTFNVYASDKPFCAVIEAEDLASGLVTQGPEQCFGAELVDQLGALVLDPADTLDCELQQCEVVNGMWDPMQCTPFEAEPTGSASQSDSVSAGESGSDGGTQEDGGEKACACRHATPGDASLAALGSLGVLALLRRRRGRG